MVANLIRIIIPIAKIVGSSLAGFYVFSLSEDKTCDDEASQTFLYSDETTIALKMSPLRSIAHIGSTYHEA